MAQTKNPQERWGVSMDAATYESMERRYEQKIKRLKAYIKGLVTKHNARVKELEGALKKYGHHGLACNIMGECSCGFGNLIKDIEKEGK